MKLSRRRCVAPARHKSRRGNNMKTSVRAGTLNSAISFDRRWVWAFAVAAVLALPSIGHAQGIIGGAEEGAYRGNRAAGPVGGVVGGAVGAGVGGAVGAVNGVLGVPNRGYYRHR